MRIQARDAVLVGDLLVPAQPRAARLPGAVLVHGSGRFERAVYRDTAARLAAMGLAVLLYDKRGVGESSGRYREVTTENSDDALAELADDALHALERLLADPRVDPARVGLYGASQAGWILPLAAERRLVRFLVILSGPAVSVGLEIRHGRLNGEGRTPVAGDELARQLAAFQGPHGYDPEPALRRLRTPTLWIMGDRDQNLPLPETLRALAALPATASGTLVVVRFADADHGMYRPDGSRVPWWDAVAWWLSKQGVLDPAYDGTR